MKRKFSNESGSVLALTLIVMLVLMILGTALLNMSLAENKFAIHQEDKLQAYYIARSGAQAVAEYMVLDNHGDAKKMVGTSVANTSVGGGSFSVSVTQDPLNADTINVISSGTYKNTTQNAKLKIYKTSSGVGGLYNYAIIAKNDITSSASGSKSQVKGGLATVEGEIDLGAHVNYDNATENALIMLPEVELLPAYNQKFGVITDPFTLPVSGQTEMSTVNGTKVYNYYATGINLKNGSLDIVDTTTVDVGVDKPNVVVHLYVEGDIIIETKGSLNVDEKTMLYIYVKGEHNVILTGRGAQHNVYIYAPDSDIEWNNAQPDGEIVGGIVGNNITITNQIQVRHNSKMSNYSNLNTSNVGITYTGYKWID